MGLIMRKGIFEHRLPKVLVEPFSSLYKEKKILIENRNRRDTSS